MYIFWNELDSGRVIITRNLSKSKAISLYRFYEKNHISPKFGWREDDPNSLEQKILVSKSM